MSACRTLSIIGSVAYSVLYVVVLGFFGARDLAVAQTASVTRAATPSSGYRIAGTIVSKADGHPLPRARVTVRDAKDPQKLESIVTSEDGKFEFNNVPAGKYSLAGAKRGFISAAYDQHEQYFTAIVTGAGLDTETLLLRLAPDAVITGKVLDEVGEPVRHASVMLYYDDHGSGIDQIQQVRGTQTDDRGAYEFTPLRPGIYFLSATAKPWYAVHPASEGEDQSATARSPDRTLDVAYPVTYYPDATEAESAAPISVQGGERVQTEIRLNSVPSLRLRFRVPGAGTNGFQVPQIRQSAFDGSTFVQNDGARLVSPGVIEVTGIPAGRYNVRLDSGGGSGIQMNGVELAKDGEEVDTAYGEALSSVKVSVKIPDEPAPPSRLGVGLRSSHRVFTAGQQVDAKGEAEFRQIAPGRYEVVVWGAGKAYTVAHMSAEGAEVSGHTLTVAAGSNPSLSLTLVAGSAEVQGLAQRAGKAFAGAMIVLVPKHPESNLDLFRRDQSDLDGTFTFHGVVPGPYMIVAIENGWDLDWSQPNVIAAYAKHERAIQVANQNGRAMNIAEPVEVQAK